jgi:hypothetical protein
VFYVADPISSIASRGYRRVIRSAFVPLSRDYGVTSETLNSESFRERVVKADEKFVPGDLLT